MVNVDEIGGQYKQVKPKPFDNRSLPKHRSANLKLMLIKNYLALLLTSSINELRSRNQNVR